MFLFKIIRFFVVGLFLIVLGVHLLLLENDRENLFESQLLNYEKIESHIKSCWHEKKQGGFVIKEYAKFVLGNGETYYFNNASLVEEANRKQRSKQEQKPITIWVLKDAIDIEKEIFQLDIDGKRIVSFEQRLLKREISRVKPIFLMIAGFVILIIWFLEVNDSNKV